MLTNPTLTRLRTMPRTGMADAYERQQAQADATALSFDDRLGLLVDAEGMTRQNRRVARLLKPAHLRLAAVPEDIDYHQRRGLEPTLRRTRCQGSWILPHQNIVLTGPTGVGKSWLACAFGTAACRQGFSVRYGRVPRLCQEAAAATDRHAYPAWRRPFFAVVDGLIWDDWGLSS